MRKFRVNRLYQAQNKKQNKNNKKQLNGEKEREKEKRKRKIFFLQNLKPFFFFFFFFFSLFSPFKLLFKCRFVA